MAIYDGRFAMWEGPAAPKVKALDAENVVVHDLATKMILLAEKASGLDMAATFASDPEYVLRAVGLQK